MGKNLDLLLNEYTGSKSLSFLCTPTSLSIDQINFIACQFVALILSFGLKKYVKDSQARLVYCLVCGVFICNFCFGIQIFHVIISAAFSYVVICKSRSSYMPWQVFGVSMLYLSYLHIRRQFIDSVSGYSLDITGPLMVLTQKVTSLAFAVGDGRKQKEEKQLSDLQTTYAVSGVPSALEFWSYIFQFQSMLAGPLVFFNDYRNFINNDQSPSSVAVVFRKLLSCGLFAFLYLKASPMYGISYLREDEFLNETSFFYKFYYILWATSLERTKYYHAWILSDAVCNASGLGYDKASNSWDLVTNVNAWEFEKGSNLKESLDHWNKGTMRWLRYVVYERASPKVKTLATYAASAVWHGFYPGYYMTFFSGALFTASARIVRRTIRPLFVDNPFKKKVYDFITWFTTRMVVAYVSFTFVLLDFMPSIYVYMKLYFFVHIAAAGAFIALPKVAKKMSRVSQPSKVTISKLEHKSVHNVNGKTYFDDNENANLKTG